MDGELDEAGDVMDVEFAHEAGAVGIDGFRTEVEASGDFLGANALNEEGEDLVFAGAERIEGFDEGAGAFGLEEGLGVDARGEEDGTGGHSEEAIEESGGGIGFQEEAAGLGAEDLEEGFAVVTLGEDSEPGGEAAVFQAAGDFEGVKAWQGEVEEGEVRGGSTQEGPDRVAIRSLGRLKGTAVFADTRQRIARQRKFVTEQEGERTGVGHEGGGREPGRRLSPGSWTMRRPRRRRLRRRCRAW